MPLGMLGCGALGGAEIDGAGCRAGCEPLAAPLEEEKARPALRRFQGAPMTPAAPSPRHRNLPAAAVAPGPGPWQRVRDRPAVRPFPRKQARRRRRRVSNDGPPSRNPGSEPLLLQQLSTAYSLSDLFTKARNARRLHHHCNQPRTQSMTDSAGACMPQPGPGAGSLPRI